MMQAPQPPVDPKMLGDSLVGGLSAKSPSLAPTLPVAIPPPTLSAPPTLPAAMPTSITPPPSMPVPPQMPPSMIPPSMTAPPRPAPVGGYVPPTSLVNPPLPLLTIPQTPNGTPALVPQSVASINQVNQQQPQTVPAPAPVPPPPTTTQYTQQIQSQPPAPPAPQGDVSYEIQQKIIQRLQVICDTQPNLGPRYISFTKLLQLFHDESGGMWNGAGSQPNKRRKTRPNDEAPEENRESKHRNVIGRNSSRYVKWLKKHISDIGVHGVMCVPRGSAISFHNRAMREKYGGDGSVNDSNDMLLAAARASEPRAARKRAFDGTETEVSSYSGSAATAIPAGLLVWGSDPENARENVKGSWQTSDINVNNTQPNIPPPPQALPPTLAPQLPPMPQNLTTGALSNIPNLPVGMSGLTQPAPLPTQMSTQEDSVSSDKSAMLSCEYFVSGLALRYILHQRRGQLFRAIPHVVEYCMRTLAPWLENIRTQ